MPRCAYTMRYQTFHVSGVVTMQVVGDFIPLSVSEGYHMASISTQNREQFEHFVTEVKHISCRPGTRFSKDPVT